MMNEQQLAESRIGSVLHGKWRLERLLGVGGMAAVYEATHRIGRRDAIKILHPSVARSPELRARFEQEAHAVNRFVHPGAVEIRDIDTTEDGAPFLVMELLEGEPLSQRVGRPEGLPLDELLRFADDLLDVLGAAHESGIIHRDVKPDNLFIQSDGRLKVLDFGIARMREGTGKANRTAMGIRLGTLPYMPPEQIRGQPIDARADLFAVGAMLFRLVAGRRVHEAGTEAELASKMLSEPAPPLGTVAPSAPAGLCLIVDRALAFVREQRYPDAATMQADVREVRCGRSPSYATAALATDGPPNVVRTGPALPAAASALADAPTSQATSDGGPGPRGDGATGVTMVGDTVGVAPAPPEPPAEPTGATAVGTASALVGQAPAAGPATMVSAGIVARAGAAPATAGFSPPEGASAAGPLIAVVEAAPASAIESSAVPTLPAPATGPAGEAAVGPSPRSTATDPRAAAATDSPFPQAKPAQIAWLVAGAAVVTLLGVLLLWWALSGESAESSSAETAASEGDGGQLRPGSSIGSGARADGLVGGAAAPGRSSSTFGSPGAAASTQGGPSAGATPTPRPATPTAPPTATAGGASGGEPEKGGTGDKDKDKDKDKSKGKGKRDR